MRCHFFLIAFIFLCYGCQKPTESEYYKNVQDFIGKTPAELITAWGSPTQIINNSGKTYYIYTRQEEIPLPTAQENYPNGELQYISPLSGTPANNFDLYCQTTFVVSEGIITDWSFTGNNCKSD